MNFPIDFNVRGSAKKSDGNLDLSGGVGLGIGLVLIVAIIWLLGRRSIR